METSKGEKEENATNDQIKEDDGEYLSDESQGHDDCSVIKEEERTNSDSEYNS